LELLRKINKKQNYSLICPFFQSIKALASTFLFL
jgi:hypothetical protein